MPYRTPADRPPRPAPEEPDLVDSDVVVGLVLLIVAAPRLALAIQHARLWEPGAAVAIAMALLGISCLPVRRLVRRMAGRLRRR